METFDIVIEDPDQSAPCPEALFSGSMLCAIGSHHSDIFPVYPI